MAFLLLGQKAFKPTRSEICVAHLPGHCNDIKTHTVVSESGVKLGSNWGQTHATRDSFPAHRAQNN